MIILIGIIGAHLLGILRAKLPINDRIPYASIFVITALMVAYVVRMMHTMEPPK